MQSTLQARLGPIVSLAAADCAAASTDWTGRYRGFSAAVVSPRTTAEVVDVVRTCADLGVGLVPQGGNTGLVAGGTPLGGEVVLNTRRLRRLDAVDTAGATLIAGAGVSVGEVQRAAERSGLRYGVDFAARDSATLGGTIATNAGGVHVRQAGDTRAQLLGVEAVTGRGEIIGDLRGLYKDNTGYHLPGLLSGSEGTLAIVTAACLRLHPPLGPVVSAMLGFDTVFAAVAAVAELRRSSTIVAGEMMFSAGMKLVAETFALVRPFDAEVPVAVLVDLMASDPAEVAERLASTDGLVAEAMAVDTSRRAELWAHRELHTEAIGRLGTPHKLDVSVPIDRLPALIAGVPEAVRRLRPQASTWLFGHAVDGNMHVNITGLDPDDDDVDDAVLRVVVSLGGSISAEHGIGRAKRRWLRLNRTDAEIDTFRSIKAAFDPHGILNPGCLLPD